MIKIGEIISRSKRALRQSVGKELWSFPEMAVPHIRLGSEYGGWVVCTSAELNSKSIVYSVGIGDDISFDLAMIVKFGCDVFAFDPTPKSIAWIKNQKLPTQLHFFPWGLSGVDGTKAFAAPRDVGHVSYSALKPTGELIECEVRRLSTIVEKLNHKNVDLLKIDIEGSEYDVIDDLQKDKLRPQQLLIEFHHNLYDIKLEKTKSCLEKIRIMGYKIFYISPSGREYSFLLDK